MSQRHTVANLYDGFMLGKPGACYFRDFCNYGSWTSETQSRQEASVNLVETLLAFVPEKRGRILDVACGLGGTTRCLLIYYRPPDVVGINLSEVQLARARHNTPGCTFLRMDATRLGFPEASFESLLCVKAAFHFDTRDQFFREAHRVLRPGGWLLHSDILFRRMPRAIAPWLYLPAANSLASPGALRQRMAAAGFQNIRVLDATDGCWGGLRDNLRRRARRERRAGRLSLRESLSIASFGISVGWILRYYVVASAQTRATESPAATHESGFPPDTR